MSQKTQVVTANRLRDGAVVYLAAGDGWSEDVNQARVADDGGDALLAIAADAVRDREVIDAYLIEVKAENGGVVPTSYREVIRAVGPSVRTDLCREVAGVSNGK